jgi:hypothetical protein
MAKFPADHDLVRLASLGRGRLRGPSDAARGLPRNGYRFDGKLNTAPSLTPAEGHLCVIVLRLV